MTDLLATLPIPWRTALTLAWESFQVGSPPIGAAVTDADGAVVATGRSRRFDPDGPPGHLANTPVAHAEVNALAQLRQLPARRYADHELWTTLRPCPMCAAAAMTTGVGTVHFAAPDPTWTGAERLPELNPAVAARWPTYDGPRTGWLAQWQILTTAIFHLWHRSTGSAIRARTDYDAAVVDLAVAVVKDPAWHGRLRRVSLPDALGELIPLLPEPTGAT